MIEFNTIQIIGPEALQAALTIETDPVAFRSQMEHLIENYGLQDSLEMLGAALFGSGDLSGLIKPKYRIVEEFDVTGDPNDFHLEEI